MSYAVKIGTTEAQWIDNNPLPDGCVRYDGDLFERMTWDDATQNIRPMTDDEIARGEIAPVSPWQIRKALNTLGLREAVEAAVAASNDISIKDGWEFAAEFRRDDSFVVGLGYALGKTDADLDGLFALAASL